MCLRSIINSGAGDMKRKVTVLIKTLGCGVSVKNRAGLLMKIVSLNHLNSTKSNHMLEFWLLFLLMDNKKDCEE